jgi:hypothetical protein
MSKGKLALVTGEILSDRIVRIRAQILAFFTVIIRIFSVYLEVDHFVCCCWVAITVLVVVTVAAGFCPCLPHHFIWGKLGGGT